MYYVAAPLVILIPETNADPPIRLILTADND